MRSFGSIWSCKAVVFAALVLAGTSGGASPALDEYADAVRTSTGAPGVAVAQFSTNALDVGVAGVRRQGQSALVTSEDRFHLGSNVKAMTAVVIAEMVEAGQLRWTDTLATLLPTLTNMHPSYRDKTLLDLVTHRAGVIGLLDLESLAALPPLSPDPRTARQAFAAWALQREPDLPAGVDAQYSNGGFAVAAGIAENIAGQSFEALLRRYLARLGIAPIFDWPASGQAAQPWGHTGDRTAWIENDPDAEENRFPAFLNPAGNLSMSLADYARTVRMHMRGQRGQCDLLTPASYAFLNTPQSSLGLGPAWEAVVIDGEPTSLFSGSAGTFYVLVAFQAQRNRGVVVAVNAVEETEAFVDAMDAALFDLLAAPGLGLSDNGFEGCN